MKKIFSIILFYLITVIATAQCIAPKNLTVYQEKDKGKYLPIVAFKIKDSYSPVKEYGGKITNVSSGISRDLVSWITEDVPQGFVQTRITNLVKGDYVYFIKSYCDFGYLTQSSDSLIGKITVK